jgi:DNA/RNA-binding domain of Phe-tRNA-synthetase-like protein
VIEARLAPGIASRLRVAALHAAPVAVGPAGPPLIEEIRDRAAALLREHAGRRPAEIEALRPARELYRGFGIDPTRTRPSSEALLRRVLRGLPPPRVLNAVDLGNLLSLRFLLPIGLYDAGKIRGGVTVREGAPGESYAGIRKEEVRVAGRPVVADERGPFGNPTSDSLRTCVEAATRELWMVVFTPASYPAERLRGHIADAAAAFERHLAGPAGPVATRHGLL